MVSGKHTRTLGIIATVGLVAGMFALMAPSAGAARLKMTKEHRESPCHQKVTREGLAIRETPVTMRITGAGQRIGIASRKPHP